MKDIQKFFWVCSGSSLSLIKRCPSDANKYAGIGATIFFTGLLAAVSASYALYTIFDNYIVAVLFGLLWGAMIFNLDRYIVSSMKKNSSKWKEFFMALPRLMLAILIAIVISKPLEIKIFDSEISAELIAMEQRIYKEQEDLLLARYQPTNLALETKIENLKKEISDKASERDALALIAQQEADGTGGSMQRNLGPIYKVKKADADRADQELKALTETNQQLIADALANIAASKNAMNDEIINMGRQRLNGMAARIDALSNLTKRSEAIYWANIFIILLFIAIETAPIFVKLISDRGPYDDQLASHEKVFEVHNKEKINGLDQNLKENVTIYNNDSENLIDDKVSVANELREETKKAKSEVSKGKIQHWKEVELRKIKEEQYKKDYEKGYVD